MGDGVCHRVVLDLLDEHELAVDRAGLGLEAQQMGAFQVSHPAAQLEVVHLHREPIRAPAVNHAGQLAVATQTAGVALVAGLPCLYRYFDCFQTEPPD